MPITISERLRPFSHVPGTFCPVPGSFYSVQLFPCLLRLFRWGSTYPFLVKEFKFQLKGTVKDFTIQNDLERGLVRIWGETAHGFIRYEISGSGQGAAVHLYVEKAPAEGLVFIDGESEYRIHVRQQVDLLTLKNAAQEAIPCAGFERLSLGSHKAQDWDLIRRRLDLTEILPCWHRLGQWIPSLTYHPISTGMGALLKACEESIDRHRPDESSALWLQLFQAAFQGILTPFWEDHSFQGLVAPAELPSDSPLGILVAGSRMIRRHFFEQKTDGIHILPALPPEFHCGRLLSVQAEERGVFDLEWTKKIVRRVSFYSSADQEVILHFKKVKSCRIRKKQQEKGVEISSGSPLALEKNCHYFFDNFN